MFSDIAPVYDLVKAHRDYAGEASVIRRLIASWTPQAKKILEVACGTGTLLAKLHEFDRVGLDVSPQMLDVARKKLGANVALHEGKMEDFQLPGPGIEVLLCLDGAIGYVGPADLERTLSTFARLLASGGLLIVEPWFTPDEWEPGKPHVIHHQGDGITVVRVGYGYPDGTIEFHNVVGTAEGIHTFDERYSFTLYLSDVMQTAFAAAGFIEVCKEAAPCYGRGLWMARKA